MFESIVQRILHPRLNSQNADKHQVIVNVYDMIQPSMLTNIGYYALGVGIFHSGVEICGREYCFGGHDYPNITGVFVVEPKVGLPELQLKQSINMGCTNLTQEEIIEVLSTISKEFTGSSYSLLMRNCNHFTEELVRRLTGKSVPLWINRAAKLGNMFPCVVPTEWVEPPEFEDQDIASPTMIMASESAIPEGPKT